MVEKNWEKLAGELFQFQHKLEIEKVSLRNALRVAEEELVSFANTNQWPHLHKTVKYITKVLEDTK